MDAVAAARTIAPQIAARANEIENARRLPPDLAADMARAGLFRLIVPQIYGGPEVSVADLVGAIETVGHADASAGWCMMIAATTALNAAYLPAEFAREIYQDALGVTGGVFAPLGKAVREGNDYRINGRWAWASGSQHCNWLLGGCLIIEDGAVRTLPNGGPDHRMVFFPAAQATLIDTWNVTGLKGTGSLDMMVENIVVPIERSVSLIVDKPRVEGPLYAFPAFGMLALGVAAVALGNARAALEDVMTLAGAKKPQGSRRSLAERGHTQMEIAKTTAAIGSARAFLYDAIGEAWRTAESGASIGLQQRAHLRLAATHAVRVCAESTRTLYDLAGGTAVYLDNPIQRRFRDGHVMTQHIMVQASTYEVIGRALFDLPLDDSTL